MADGIHSSTGTLVPAPELAHTLALRDAPNGLRFSSFGETRIADSELARIVAAVPASIAPALAARAFYFVPLALPDADPTRSGAPRGPSDRTLISPAYTPELSDEAMCHRIAQVPAFPGEPAHEGIFISAALLRDTFALAFEFFINVAHLFAAEAGVPESFSTLAWSQALADTRGETSQDAHEARATALAHQKEPARAHPDEKAKSEFLEAAFADALAIYLLSLAVDFDYSELREREYPLLAPAALAERLRLVARLFPHNSGYEFSIRYRRRA